MESTDPGNIHNILGWIFFDGQNSGKIASWQIKGSSCPRAERRFCELMPKIGPDRGTAGGKGRQGQSRPASQANSPPRLWSVLAEALDSISVGVNPGSTRVRRAADPLPLDRLSGTDLHGCELGLTGRVEVHLKVHLASLL